MFAISTDSVAPRESSEFWDEQFTRLLGLRSTRTEPIGKLPFRGDFQAWQLNDGIRLSKFEIESSRLTCKGDIQVGTLAIMIPLAGDDEATWDGRTYHVSPDNIYIVNCVEEAKVLTNGRVKRLLMIFPRDQIRKVFPYIDSPHFKGIHVMPAQSEAASLFIGDTLTLYRNANDAGEQPGGFEMEHLHYLLHSLPQKNGDMRSRLRSFHKERIRTFVKSNLHASLSVASIADAVNLSQSYVYNLFSNEPVSLMKWVWQQRLDHCRQDLESPALCNCSIREIAYAWGFNDPAHFTHVFHQQFGMPPTEYREQHRRRRLGGASASLAFLS